MLTISFRKTSAFVLTAACAAVLTVSPSEAQVGDNAVAVASDVTSADGSQRIVFESQERLVPEDTDDQPDIYVRYTPPGGEPVTELVSSDDRGVLEPTNWHALGAQRGLIYAHADVDISFDKTIFVFVRAGNGRWVRGTAVPGVIFLKDILNDGSLVVEADDLVPSDTNGHCDLYRIPPPVILSHPLFGILGVRTAQPELLTPGVASQDCPSYAGGFVTTSGEVRIVFSTERRLLPAQDLDQSIDVYARSAAGYQLMSRATGPARDVEQDVSIVTSNEPATMASDIFGDAVSPDASTVIFRTSEPLVGSDSDATADFYVGRLGVATPVLVPGNGVAKLVVNGFVFFQSSAALAGNLDSDVDIFRMDLATRAVVHVSRSRTMTFFPVPQELGTADASFVGASELGNRAWFRSVGHFGVPNPTPDFQGADIDDLYEANLEATPGEADHLRRFTRSRATAPGAIFGDPSTPAAATTKQLNSMFLGRTVLFRSIRQLSSAEASGTGVTDVYAFGPGLQLVTTPTDGPHPENANLSSVLGFGGTPFRNSFATLQPDRGIDPFTVVFETRKRLADTDTDDDVDIYVRDLGTGTTLHVSTP